MLDSRLRSVGERMARTTPRERLLLGGLIGAALLYLPMAALEWKSSQEDQYVESLSALQTARIERATAARLTGNLQHGLMVADMEDWALTGTNLPIVKVAFEQRILDAAKAADMTNLRITMDPELGVVGPVSWLGATVQADLRWTSTFAFLDEAAEWPEGFRVVGFSYELLQIPVLVASGSEAGPPPAGRVTIEIAVPVEIAPGQGALS